MDKMDKQIMVVKKELIFKDDYFEGYKLASEIDFESRILRNFEYMRRGDAEVDIRFKQPISFTLIFNPKTEKVYSYQRGGKNTSFAESRLYDKWTWGIGGHIDQDEEKDVENPIHTCAIREIKEEIDLKSFDLPKPLAYINYDSDEVSKYHFAIVYLIETDLEEIEAIEDTVVNGDFRSIKELDEICNSAEYQVEAWAKISLEAIKKYLNKNT